MGKLWEMPFFGRPLQHESKHKHTKGLLQKKWFDDECKQAQRKIKEMPCEQLQCEAEKQYHVLI